jgi:hypothetical protein
MIVSGLPTWLVALIAVLITAVYYFRYRKGWMGHPLAVLFIFVLHFFFFAWGIVIFVLTEWMRARANARAKEKYSKK